MIAHMPGEYQWALDTETMLSPDGLQTAIYRLCALYTTEFGMSLPAINSPHLLFQYVKQLALPLEIYPAVKNLNKIINFTFKYSLGSDSRVRRNATSHPEAQLMALVVVATKLIFPFDSDVMKRYPRSLNEPAAQRIDWKKWMELRKQRVPDAEATSAEGDEGATRSKPPLQKGQEVEITDTDIFQMSAADLDQYMDWYQRTWIKSNDAEDNPNKEIQAMFLLEPLPAEDPRRDPEHEVEEAQLDIVREVHAAMKMNRIVSEEDAAQLQLDSETPVEIKRPGEGYRLYPRVENLPETARAFYEAAAEAACMSVERVVNAVRQTETKIENWKREKKRAERFGEEGGEDEGDEDGNEDMEMIG
jgi:RNA polymerase I-specific transcription initiation factor RRN7